MPPGLTQWPQGKFAVDFCGTHATCRCEHAAAISSGGRLVVKVPPHHCIGVGICSGEDVDVHAMQLDGADAAQLSSQGLPSLRMRVARYTYEGAQLRAGALRDTYQL